MKNIKMSAACGWAAVLCVALFSQTYVRAERPGGIDLTSYLLSARALLQGGSPYLLPTPFPYLYPATLAFVLIPLTFVPSTIAVTVWFALNAAAAVWAIRTVLLAARPDLEIRPGDVALFLALFFTFFFTVVQSNLRNGQVNFLVISLCVGAGLLFSTRGRSVFICSALSWSLAVAIKLVPLALLPFFALRRRWPWLLASALLITAWCLLPAVVVGSRIIDIYQQYWRVFLASSFAPRVQPLDFSLAATIASATAAPLTPMLKVSAAAVVLGWIIQADARRLRPVNAADGRAFALYSLAIPLVSPQSEMHHLAFMLPAAAIVAAEWWRAGRRASRALQIPAAIAALLYLAATATPIASGPLFCVALIAFGVALMKAEVRRKADPARKPDEAAANDNVSGGVRL